MNIVKLPPVKSKVKETYKLKDYVVIVNRVFPNSDIPITIHFILQIVKYDDGNKYLLNNLNWYKENEIILSDDFFE